MVTVWRSKINFGFKGSEYTIKHQERKFFLKNNLFKNLNERFDQGFVKGEGFCRSY